VRPINEIFHVYPDGDGTVRTDHFVRWWGLSVLHLHYHITPDREETPATVPFPAATTAAP